MMMMMMMMMTFHLKIDLMSHIARNERVGLVYIYIYREREGEGGSEVVTES